MIKMSPYWALTSGHFEKHGGLIYSWYSLHTVRNWTDVMQCRLILENFEEEPFKSLSPDDPRTTSEQIDVNQQASAVGLYCFWFACDHANPLLLMSFFFSLFLSNHLFFVLGFFSGQSLSLSGIHCELAECTSSAERDARGHRPTSRHWLGKKKKNKNKKRVKHS